MTKNKLEEALSILADTDFSGASACIAETTEEPSPKRHANVSTARKLRLAKNFLDGTSFAGGVVYKATETMRYYWSDLDQLEALGQRIADGQPDAYSEWCQEEGFIGDGFRTEEEAAKDAGFI